MPLNRPCARFHSSLVKDVLADPEMNSGERGVGETSSEFLGFLKLPTLFSQHQTCLAPPCGLIRLQGPGGALKGPPGARSPISQSHLLRPQVSYLPAVGLRASYSASLFQPPLLRRGADTAALELPCEAVMGTCQALGWKQGCRSFLGFSFQPRCLRTSAPTLPREIARPPSPRPVAMETETSAERQAQHRGSGSPPPGGLPVSSRQ